MQVWQITDVLGDVKATITDHHGGMTTIPVDDTRLSEVTLDLWDPAVKHALPLQRYLRATYDDDLVFWGPIASRDINVPGGEGRMVVRAQDPTFRCRHRFFGFGDEAVDDGVAYDGPGFWAFIEATEPTPTQIGLGVPKTGIVLGADTSNPLGVLHKVNRGSNIWDEWLSRMQLDQSPHWNLRPIDADHPGVVAEWEPGLFAEMSFYANRVVDRRETVVFHHGFGRNNCSIGVNEAGAEVVNYAVRTAMGGEVDPGESGSRVLTLNIPKMIEQGIMQAWEATSYATDTEAKSSAAQDAFLEKLEPHIQAEADAVVDAYSSIPHYFTITVIPQGELQTDVAAEEPYRYLTHFTEGDRVRGHSKVGEWSETVEGRIKAVRLTDDERGQTTTALDCVPTVLPSGG